MEYKASVVPKRLFRTKEAAHYLATSTDTIRRLAQDGVLPILQDNEGGPWRFDLADLDKYVEQIKRVVLG
jgi:excisionase family DNA binding protein